MDIGDDGKTELGGRNQGFAPPQLRGSPPLTFNQGLITKHIPTNILHRSLVCATRTKLSLTNYSLRHSLNLGGALAGEQGRCPKLWQRPGSEAGQIQQWRKGRGATLPLQELS